MLKPSSLPADILCPVSEPNSGRAFIDPVSMQVVRLEQKRPRHELELGTYSSLLADNFGSVASGSPAASQVSINVNGVSTPMPSGDMGLRVAPGTLWDVDVGHQRYAPVVIDNKTFWLPTTITSTTATNTGPLIVWNFNTKYSNYHLLTVTSKILPGYSDVPKQ